MPTTESPKPTAPQTREHQRQLAQAAADFSNWDDVPATSFAQPMLTPGNRGCLGLPSSGSADAGVPAESNPGKGKGKGKNKKGKGGKDGEKGADEVIQRKASKEILKCIMSTKPRLL